MQISASCACDAFRVPLRNQVDERRRGYPVGRGGERSSPCEDATMMDLSE